MGRATCNAVCTQLEALPDEHGVRVAIDMLEAHVPREHVLTLVDEMERWCAIGAGCSVESISPPRLMGVIPRAVSYEWRRAERLVEYGMLTYDDSGKGTFHSHWY